MLVKSIKLSSLIQDAVVETDPCKDVGVVFRPS